MDICSRSLWQLYVTNKTAARSGKRDRVCHIFVISYYYKKRKKSPHFKLHYCKDPHLGVAFPLGICFIYLGYNHAISEFIYQIYFDTSSKGSIFDIVIGKYINIYWDKLYGIWAIICFYTAYIVKKVPLHLNKKRQLADILQKVLIVISIILFCHSYSGIFIEIWNKTFFLRISYIFYNRSYTFNYCQTRYETGQIHIWNLVMYALFNFII